MQRERNAVVGGKCLPITLALQKIWCYQTITTRVAAIKHTLMPQPSSDQVNTQFKKAYSVKKNPA